jgi:bifunctional non-homologous end joining protein LigD
VPLDLYHAKRDFKRTPEPRGHVARAAKGKKRRFVIQRHAATRLHYDFRLEHDGVLKSWAVTKVPSYDTATKRLAVEVEDHPMDYGGFEGTIPKGEYGGGTVQLWDVGTWEPKEDPDEGLRRGNLKFTLSGQRLKGGWALIRMKDWNKGDRVRKSSKRYNWLLIKERDEFVRSGDPDALLKEDTSVKSGRTLEEIAANKRGRVWHSNRSGAETEQDKPKTKPAKSAMRSSSANGAKKKIRTTRKSSPRRSQKRRS